MSIVLRILFFLPLYYSSFGDILTDPISTSVLFPNRKSSIIFVSSSNVSEVIFSNLLNFTIELEKEAFNNFHWSNYEIDLHFGKTLNSIFSKNTSISFDLKDWCPNYEECFESSKTNDIKSVVDTFFDLDPSCTITVEKEFYLIVTDQCLSYLNMPLKDRNECQMDFCEIYVLLPTLDDVERCKAELNTSQIYLNYLAVNEYSNDTTDYFDMNVMCYSNFATSKLNVFAIAPSKMATLAKSLLNKMLLGNETLLNESDFANLTECRNRHGVGYSQFEYNTVQDVHWATIPTNFEHAEIFLRTFNNSIQYFNYTDVDCTYIQSVLTALNALSSSEIQFNVLLTTPPLNVNCFDFNLKWNNTMRYLEVFVVFPTEEDQKSDQAKTYLNLISPNSRVPNHLGFLNLFNLPSLWSTITTCRKYIEQAELLPAKKLSTQTKHHSFIVIIVVALVVLIILIITVFGYFKIKEINRKIVLRNFLKNNSKEPQEYSEYARWIISDSNLVINYDKLLGSGNMSNVYKAFLINTNGLSLFFKQKVAVKVLTLREGAKASDITSNSELKALIKLENYPHIIQLKGWSMIANEPVIVMELHETDLLSYIQKQPRKEITPKMNLQILWQVCKALVYIAELGLIHRDIACRNVLVTKARNSATVQVKVCDFGLSREADKSGEYHETEHIKLSFKWLSIEALTDRIFSEKSDVWAFGVLCYEIFTGGVVPYSSQSLGEMTQFLLDGKRLEIPEDTPPQLHALMMSCWTENRDERPNFEQIQDELENMLDEYGYLQINDA